MQKRFTHLSCKSGMEQCVGIDELLCFWCARVLSVMARKLIYHHLAEKHSLNVTYIANSLKMFP